MKFKNKKRLVNFITILTSGLTVIALMIGTAELSFKTGNVLPFFMFVIACMFSFAILLAALIYDVLAYKILYKESEDK